MARSSSAVERLVRRRRRVTQLGILAALLVAALFLSVHWWGRPPGASKPGKDTPWNTVSSPAGGFAVRLPGVALEKSRPVNVANHSVALTEYSAAAGDVTYTAGFADTPTNVRSALSPDDLLNATRPDYETILGGRVVDARPLNDKPFPGREWRLDGGEPARPLRSVVRVYFTRGRLFHLAATGPLPFDQLSSPAAKLSDSFELSEKGTN